MNVVKLSEYGYEEAALGFSLSYNTNIDRVKQILPKYAFGVPGEGKFLEQMIIFADVNAPRFWWQEADTYRVGTCKQSESTMHTLSKSSLTDEDFEYPISGYSTTLSSINDIIFDYKQKKVTIAEVKNLLPEGFLQRRIWMFSYKSLQTIYVQRINHRLTQWRYFLETLVSQLDHPEFIIKDYEK